MLLSLLILDLELLFKTMKKITKKIFLFSALFFFYITNSFAESAHFIDFSKVLNKSKVGAEAQLKLKKKFENESNKYKKIEIEIRNEETKLIAKKKLITKEEYTKDVQNLRKKVAALQKNKQNSLANIAKSRNDSKKALLKAVNPMINKYMENNNIRMVLDKNSVVMGDSTLEITNSIIAILDKELSTLKIN